MSTETVKDILHSIRLDEKAYLDLLAKLIGEAESLQDAPPELIPTEDNAIKHLLETLKPFTKEEGGVLQVEHVTYVKDRGNVIITYPAAVETTKCVSFVGSHLDVVPADAEVWERNPFELIIEGDKLYGRGTTDCLGHVALITILFTELAKLKPKLNCNVHAVFIASEEASNGPGVGVDGLMKAGKLDAMKEGPVFWIDCADSQPCIGTAGAITWHLKAVGHRFHSGLPHKGINGLEFAMDAVKYVQEKFYSAYPAHPQEEVYKFATPSTMKPTQIETPKGGLNSLPPYTTVSGDIRLTPFYDVPEVKAAVQSYVDELNADLSLLPTRGPCSRYEVPDLELRGKLELTFGSEDLTGIACKLDSAGFKALCTATNAIVGKAVPYSICGSLPLVDTLQKAGYDIQLTGYGLSSTYHAENEYALLSDMKNAAQILPRVISLIHGEE
eukprot:TRINITY_DN485_c0_g1_i1.p1 TRINITY_DN485_c0_g1~~TRINITY_DN485_c0_g1_i1.p1  ORF type:complete len:454 (-),score=133.87 TRINITY_DN485_c0_g1_i1:156-1484(-)